MAKKRKLSELIGEETQQTNLPESKDSVTTEISDLGSLKVTDSQTYEATDLGTTEVPKYLTLVRKEARLREDQLENLTSLTRSLNRRRRGTGERITENTLIRVAVDLLLNKSDELKGITEQDLLASMGLD